MTSLATLRGFGPWLLGLFLAAQIIAVTPLLSAHTVHIAGSIHSIARGDGADAGHGGHQHGDEDSLPQHHALHDMAGVVAVPLAHAELAVAFALIIARPRDALTAADPARLERPPKSILSV
jgi:hypothetical protein